MPRFGFCGPFYTNRSKVAEGQRLVNRYPEVVESGQGVAHMILHPTPGQQTFTRLSDGPVRGQLTIPFTSPTTDRTFAVGGAKLFEIFEDGTNTELGVVGDDGNHYAVFMAYSPTEIAITSVNNLYIYNYDTDTFSGPILDTEGEPVLAVSVVYLDGKFLINVPATQTIQYSALFDGLTWDPSDFFSAEKIPDRVLTLHVEGGDLFAFGNASVEVFGGSRNPDEPFEHRALIQLGTPTPLSPARQNGRLTWLSSDAESGGYGFRSLQGYNPIRVSNHAVENRLLKLVERYGKDALSFGRSYVFGEEGHEIYQISFPAAKQTWRYDAKLPPELAWYEVGCWNQRLGEYDAHHSITHAFAFGKHLVGDRGGQCCSTEGGVGGGGGGAELDDFFTQTIIDLVDAQLFNDEIEQRYTSVSYAYDPAQHTGVSSARFEVNGANVTQASQTFGEIPFKIQLIDTDSPPNIYATITTTPRGSVDTNLDERYTAAFTPPSTAKTLIIRFPLYEVTDNADQLNGAINAVTTSIVVDDGTNFQIGDKCLIQNTSTDETNREYVLITNIVGNTLTVTRGVDGSYAAATHADNSYIVPVLYESASCYVNSARLILNQLNPTVLTPQVSMASGQGSSGGGSGDEDDNNLDAWSTLKANTMVTGAVANTTLNGGINDVVTTITLTNAANFTTPLPVFGLKGRMIIQDGASDTTNREVVRIESKAGNDVTVTRGVDCTTAVAHGNGSYVEFQPWGYDGFDTGTSQNYGQNFWHYDASKFDTLTGIVREFIYAVSNAGNEVYVALFNRTTDQMVEGSSSLFTELVPTTKTVTLAIDALNLDDGDDYDVRWYLRTRGGAGGGAGFRYRAALYPINEADPTRDHIVRNQTKIRLSTITGTSGPGGTLDNLARFLYEAERYSNPVINVEQTGKEDGVAHTTYLLNVGDTDLGLPALERYPTQDVAVSGSWTNPTNVQAEDGAAATVTLNSSGATAIREQGLYGFDGLIPVGAVFSDVMIHGVVGRVGQNATQAARVLISGVAEPLHSYFEEESEVISGPPDTVLFNGRLYNVTQDRDWVIADLADGTLKTRIQATQPANTTPTTYHWDSVSIMVTWGTNVTDSDLSFGTTELELQTNGPISLVDGSRYITNHDSDLGADFKHGNMFVIIDTEISEDGGGEGGGDDDGPDSGRIYHMSQLYNTDDGCDIRRLRISPHFSYENRPFTINYLELKVETGTAEDGDDDQADPYVSMRYSRNGGKSWSFERTRSLGKLGEHELTLKWDQLGAMKQFTCEMVDTSNVSFVDAYIKTKLGNSARQIGGG